MSQETPRGMEGTTLPASLASVEQDLQILSDAIDVAGGFVAGYNRERRQALARISEIVRSRPAAAPAVPFRCTEDEGGLIVEDATGNKVFTASHGSNALDIWDTRPEAMREALLTLGRAFLRDPAPAAAPEAPTFDDVAHQVLISFLERVGSGETSGSFAEWPQLRPACRYAAQRLRAAAAPEALDLDALAKALCERFPLGLPWTAYREDAEAVNAEYHRLRVSKAKKGGAR